ncbi:MAG: hypothetical protein EOS58_30585 [Mesorhizobium sp.]|nr:MAG: hypothetical protein EOS58_30585 [Mesorhizobium sp.]
MHYRRWWKYGSPYTLKQTSKGEPMAWLMAMLSYDSDACLKWPYATDQSGYGKLTYRGRGMNACHVMCEKAHGPRPSSKYEATHSCGKGNEGCVNHKHLSWGTRVKNVADRFTHGTGIFGEKHPQAKLTEAQAREIYRRAWSGLETEIAIASDFDSNSSQVNNIKHRKIWKRATEGIDHA